MKARLKTLREKAGQLNTQIQAKVKDLGTEGRAWSAEDETEWKRLNAEYDAVADQIDKIQRALEIDTRMTGAAGDPAIGRDDVDPATGKPKRKKSDPTGEDEARTARMKSLAFRSWFLSGTEGGLRREHIQACRALKFNPNKRGLQLDIGRTEDVRALAEEMRDTHPRLRRERRTMSAITGATGGVLVPPGFLATLEQNMLFYGPMLAEFTLLRTDTGAPLPMPTADDTFNEGEIVGESADNDGSTDPAFAAVVLGAHKFSSKMVKVPYELIEDSAFDIEAYIGAVLGERLGRVQNRRFTTGTGTKQPRGYMIDASLGVTAGSATAITGDELTVDLVHSLDPAYRNGAKYAMHDTVLAHVRKLKDGEGRPLFQSNLSQGFPDTIDGRQYVINQHMATSVATGNKTVAFGQFSKYVVRQVRGIRFRRLDERYAEKDQVAFLALLRADGGLLDAGTSPVKYLQQA